MDLELTDRLLDWLAFFLSQQDFGWDWDSWSFVADLPDYSTQKVFVRNLLTKCANMTDIKAFVEQLPEALKSLVTNNRQGVFKYITESKDNYDAQIVLDAMSSGENEFTKGSFEVESSGDEFIEIFTECFLYKTQKSLRHVKKLADKFMVFLKDKLSEESAQVKFLEVATRVWQNDELKGVNILDELLNLDLISPITMIK